MSAQLDISFLTWALTVGLVVALLAVDLVVAAKRPHHVGFGEATAWSVFYVAVAVGFGVWFTLHYGSGPGTEYFVGYLVVRGAKTRPDRPDLRIKPLQVSYSLIKPPSTRRRRTDLQPGSGTG